MHTNKMGYDNIFGLAVMSFNVMCNDNPFCYNASMWNQGINVGQYQII